MSLIDNGIMKPKNKGTLNPGELTLVFGAQASPESAANLTPKENKILSHGWLDDMLKGVKQFVDLVFSSFTHNEDKAVKSYAYGYTNSLDGDNSFAVVPPDFQPQLGNDPGARLIDDPLTRSIKDTFARAHNGETFPAQPEQTPETSLALPFTPKIASPAL